MEENKKKSPEGAAVRVRYQIFESEGITEDTTKFFPSKKNLHKYPLIDVKGDVNEYIRWIRDHAEIDRRVPPVFKDFQILFSSADKHNYSIFVHYNDDLTGFYFRTKMDGRTLLVAHVDYEYLNNSEGRMQARASIPAGAAEIYEEEWLRNTVFAGVYTVIGVQAYILYFKPDVTEAIYSPEPTSKKQSENKQKRSKSAVQHIKIRKSKIKYITLNDTDRPARNVNYRKLAWSVRGHYRHVGKNKTLKYIQPFQCTRGGRKDSKYKSKPKKYIMPENID